MPSKAVAFGLDVDAAVGAAVGAGVGAGVAGCVGVGVDAVVGAVDGAVVGDAWGGALVHARTARTQTNDAAIFMSVEMPAAARLSHGPTRRREVARVDGR